MKATKNKIVVDAVLAVMMFLFFHYNLPRTSVVRYPGPIPNGWIRA